MISYNTLPDSTRVWVYQSNRPFLKTDIPLLKVKLIQFTESWVSHNRQLRAFGDVLYEQFIVLMVDESMAGASGCSIDKSVYFLKGLEAEYNVDLFDRMTFAFKDGEIVKTASRDEFARLYQNGVINEQTLVFDNLVNNKGDFDKHWVKKMEDSWHMRMV